MLHILEHEHLAIRFILTFTTQVGVKEYVGLNIQVNFLFNTNVIKVLVIELLLV